MTTFKTSADTSRASGDSLQTAVRILTSNGFAIVERDAASVALTGPGLNSTRQNPLLGATAIRLNLSGDRLSAVAELGGVDAMRRFLMRFPFLLGLGLGLGLGIPMGLMFGKQFGVGFGIPGAQGWMWMLFVMALAMLPVSPWLFLSPLMARHIRHRTQSAIETLVQNATRA